LKIPIALLLFSYIIQGKYEGNMNFRIAGVVVPYGSVYGGT